MMIPLWVVVVILLVGSCFIVVVQAANEKLNILQIIVDDYRPEGRIGMDDHPAGPQFNTPHMNRLAKQSVVFDAAFTMSASCGPSRASFLTGFSPDKLGYWSFVSKHWRERYPEFQSIPEYFRKNHGYLTSAVGKVFHFDDKYRDDTESWDFTEFTYPFSGGETKCTSGSYFCACGKHCTDENVGSAAVERLRFLTRQKRAWYLVVGFRRPHLDWRLNWEWMKSHDLAETQIPLPKHQDLHPSIPLGRILCMSYFP